MLALSIAFLMAVYSDVLAKEGSLLGVAVTGSLALALAGFVAVTVVPYLARRTNIGWLRAGVDYHLTRAGSLFIGSIFVLSIAALNTGNNMLFHYCPVKSRIESVGWGHRVSFRGSRTAARPVKWAFSRKG